MVCLSGDLTRQCEVDLFQAEFPDRFIQAGMAEANMMGVAAALARCGHLPFVHTFGVFATRRPLDQIISAIGYPRLPVRIIGFMPGISSPGGPSHQAIDDVALMRAVPGMTVLDVADAVEARQVCAAIADLPGPVYVRLKRGEVPVMFGDDHVLSLDQAQVLSRGGDVALFASGMMLAPGAGRGARARRARGGRVGGERPGDQAAGQRHRAPRWPRPPGCVLTARTTWSAAGSAPRWPRSWPRPGWAARCAGSGCADTFAEGATQRGLPVRPVRLVRPVLVATAWQARWAGPGRRPRSRPAAAEPGEYAPV